MSSPVVTVVGMSADNHNSPPDDAGLIRVRGAHLRNLRDIDVDFPRGRLVSFTGVSGSGKSSLAFGTVHGESQRRYLESVAPFARRLIGSAVDPRVESVTGMPPTVALEQRTSGGGPRSSVGTVTNLSNAVRLLYSRAGHHPAGVLAKGSLLSNNHLTSDAFSPNTTEGRCPTCQGVGVLREPTEESMVPDPSLSILEGTIAAWPGGWLGKNFREILETLGVDTSLPWRELPAKTREWILFTEEQPVVTVTPVRGADKTHGTYQGTWRSVEHYLLHTANSKAETSRRRALSFMAQRTCPTCLGHRLTPDALRVTYLERPITELTALPAAELLEILHARFAELPASEGSPEEEAERILLPSILPVLRTVVGLGLGHLALDRAAGTLSTGELQRLRLSAQLRGGLFGVAYVLDEPSAGLHASEKGILTELFRRFIAEGNSVLLVEHDMALVEQSDWVVDVGPGAGVDGGEVLYSGPPTGLAQVARSRTADYLGSSLPELNARPRAPEDWLKLCGITARTLADVDLSLPLGTFTAVAGVSGSGKSTLVTHVLAEVLAGRVGGEYSLEAIDAEAPEPEVVPEGHPQVREVSGDAEIARLVQITQQPIGRTPRSCLATYTGLFDRVRRLFADTAEARSRGWGISRFSFNVVEGRCPECAGTGQIEVELVFLPGSFAQCPTCRGTRYAAETLEVTYRGKTIAEVLAMSVEQATGFFADDPRISRALASLSAIGLGYLTLGQRATELSGGEAQRIKLATELQRPARGHTVYLLDEPTTGLHPADVDLLVAELNRLVERGDTVVVVEHDLRVIAGADHVIELGPGAGDQGGKIIAAGTPVEVALDPASVTGPYLAPTESVPTPSAG